MRLIEVLGPGCSRCERTASEIRAAVDRAGLDVEVRHVTDPAEIVARGVLFSIPVVLIDQVLVSRGRVPTRQEVEQWLGAGSESAPSRT
jgi:small redox-active disulfide protein 2